MEAWGLTSFNYLAGLSMISFLRKYQSIIIYSACLALTFLALRFIEYRWLIIDYSIEIYAGAVALIFLLLGIWMAKKLTPVKKEIRIIEKEILVPVVQEYFVFDEKKMQELDISQRELEVLQLVAKGMSNQEIGAELFLSVSTVKTHLSNLFFKLDVTRRTQAVQTGRALQLIP
jgi:DNA-binding CsgD family transcriptional regulator